MALGSLTIANLVARFTADTSDFDRNTRTMITRMRRSAEDLTQAGRMLTMGITAPLAGIAIQAFKTAMEFESSMTRIISLVGMARGTIEQWAPTVRDMASETGKSATELADALFFITSAGIRTNEALNVLKSSAMAAAIGLGETKNVAFAAVSAMNAYGRETMTADFAVATLIRTVREGNMEARALPMAFGRLLPVASQLEVKFTDVGAALAMMTRQGVSARLAGFGLRSVLMLIMKPTDQAKKALNKLGLTFAELRSIIRTDGLLPALELLKDTIGDNVEMMGEIMPNTRALVGVLQLVGKNVEDTRKVFAELAKTTGEDVKKTFEITAQTAKQKLAQAMGELSEAAVTLGDDYLDLAGVLEHFAGIVNGITQAFSKLPPELRLMTHSLGGLAASLGGLLLVGGAFMRLAAGMKGTLMMIGGAGGALPSAMKSLDGMTSSARRASTGFKILGTSIGGLTLGVLGAAEAGWQFGKFLDKLMGITDMINQIFGKFGGEIQTIGEAFEDSAESMDLAVGASVGLAERMGETELATRLMNAAMKGNTQEVAELQKRVNELAAAHQKAAWATRDHEAAIEGQSEEMRVAQEAMMERFEAQRAYIEGIKEEHNLMTKGDVTAKLKEYVDAYAAAKKEGIAGGIIAREMVGDVTKVLKDAAIYGMALDQSVVKMADDFNNVGYPAAKKITDEIGERLPKHINMTPGKVIPGIVKIGDKIATELTRGFGQGFDKGDEGLTSFGAQLRNRLMANIVDGFDGALSQWPAKIEAAAKQIEAMNVTIPVYPDEQVWIKFFLDLADGRYPDPRG